MARFKRGNVWWYKFYFVGQFIYESAKSSSKTVAKNAEDQRRRELEAGFNNIKDGHKERVRSLAEIITNYLVGYLAFMFARNAGLRLFIVDDARHGAPN